MEKRIIGFIIMLALALTMALDARGPRGGGGGRGGRGWHGGGRGGYYGRPWGWGYRDPLLVDEVVVEDASSDDDRYIDDLKDENRRLRDKLARDRR